MQLVLTAKTKASPTCKELAKMYDIQLQDKLETTINVPEFPKNFGIGYIVGPSGSGKSSILRHLVDSKVIDRIASEVEWTDEPVCMHFADTQDARKKLHGIGLNSIPAWLRSFDTLSGGERYRANVARTIGNNIAYDEFTSVVDEVTAVSMSHSIQKYVVRNKLQNVVFAGLKRSVIPFLRPDWIYDTADQKLTVSRPWEQRQVTFEYSPDLYVPPGPTMERLDVQLKVQPCKKDVWNHFRDHHYLSDNLAKNTRCYVFLATIPLVCTDALCAFVATIPAFGFPRNQEMPSVREHRIVILPNFQGMGLGPLVSEYIADLHVKQGRRYYSITAHPALGEYRNASEKWRPTQRNCKKKLDRDLGLAPRDCDRMHYSHEYVGSSIRQE